MNLILPERASLQGFTRLLLLCGCVSAVLPLLARRAAATEITVPFRGPASAHISYDHTYTGGYRGDGTGVEVQFGFVDPADSWNVLLEATGTKPDVVALSGSHHARDVDPGTYRYQIRERESRWVLVLVPGGTGYYELEWGDWQTRYSTDVVLNGGQADGTLLFDELLRDAVVGDIIVPEDRKLTLRGLISPPLPTPSGTFRDATIVVHGTLDPTGVELELRRHPVSSVRYQVIVDLHVSESISGVTGGTFVVNSANTSFADCRVTWFETRAAGTSFTDCADIFIQPYQGASVLGAQDAHLSLWALEDDAVVTISDSTITSSGDGLKGTLFLNRVVWSGNSNLWIGGECDVDASEVDFAMSSGYGFSVTVGNVDADSPVPTVRFHSRDSRFTSMCVGRVAPTCFSVTDGLYSGRVEVIGGYPDFRSCEFGDRVTLFNRTGATFDACLFLDFVMISDWTRSFADAPYWYEAGAPSPTIANNAFMGRYCFLGSNLLPSVGANYYGDSQGYHQGQHGFLGFSSGHAGALTGVDLNAAAVLASSPLSGPRRDTRVFPKFWMNGSIVGQNTLSHSGNTAGADGLILKGRKTLLSLDVIASDNNLEGVRVYAKWNNDEIDALPRIPLQRDRSHYSETQVRNGLATFNIILPGVDNDAPGTILNVPVEVYLDASQVPGFDPQAYPGEHQHLLTREVYLSDPPERPLRIFVQPVQVRGLLGGSWGVPSPAGVIRTLRRDMPDMLPLRGEDIEIAQLPLSTYWSPSASVTAGFLMNRIAAGMTMARGLIDMTSSEAPDFIVVVLSRSIAANFDGASLSGRRRIIFVGEHKADAVLHELGHGIGLYLGWGGEQYDLFPPDGMLVERVTAFHTETLGRRPMAHLPAEEDFWYDGGYVLDIMGRIGPIWTAPSTVQRFHDWFQENLRIPSRKATSLASTQTSMRGLRRIMMSGAVSDAGDFVPDTLTAFDVSALSGASIPPATTGDASRMHRLQAFSFIGTTLLDTTFYLEQGEPTWTATFDLPATTDRYTITRVQDGMVVFHVQSAGLVQTRFLSPEAGDVVGSLIEAEWSAETAEGADLEHLRHAVLYKTSVSGSWNWMVLPTRETEITGSSDFLPDTEYLALRLITSDGVSSVEHVVEGLSVEKRAPRVSILSPRHGDQAVAGTIWELSAEAEAFGHSGLDEGLWTSSLDGPLGSGFNVTAMLSSGMHTVRYEVESANGLSGSSDVTVVVHDVMAEVDLALEASDLTLHNHETTPEGYTGTRLLPGAENMLAVNVRNQGVDAAARVRAFVQGPFDSTLVFIGEKAVSMEPFEERTTRFAFEPESEGTYRIRIVIDEVVPPDPHVANNSREWLFSSVPSEDLVRDEYGRAMPTLFWPDPEPIVYGVPLSATQLAAAADTDGVFSYSSEVGTVLPVGAYRLDVDFAPANPANWVSAQASVDMVVVPAPLHITAHDRAKTYGDSVVFTGTEFSAADLVGDDMVVSVELACEGAAPGAAAAGSPYAITLSDAIGNGLGNYLIEYVPGSLSVAPAPLHVRADNKTKVFGSTNPPLTMRYSGLRNAESAPAVPPSIECAAVNTSPVGNYPIVLSGGHDANYQITLEGGTLTVVEGETVRLWLDDDSRAAEFGETAAATIAFDDAFDLVALDNSTPRIYLLNDRIADPAQRRLIRDYRPFAESNRWRLVVEILAARKGTVTLHWDTEAATAVGKELYLQEVHEEHPVGFPVDMGSASSITLPGDAEFEIVYAPLLDPEPVIHLKAGWNLVGNPLMSRQSAGAILDDGAGSAVNIGVIWTWENGRYEGWSRTGAFSPERGYWIYCLADSESAPITGVRADGIMLMQPGWNLVSPPADSVMTAGDGVAGRAWYWDSRLRVYRAVAPGGTLEAGRGYWIRIDSDEPVMVDLGE